MDQEQAKTNQSNGTAIAEAAKGQPKKAPLKIEKNTNCPACNKPIKKLKRYYRNNKFYCSKTCFKIFIKKTRQEQEKDKTQ